jgi:hypothetical protein
VIHQLKKKERKKKFRAKERKKVAGRSRAKMTADASDFEEKDFSG